jgi:prepilin-type processing-associated H-X9-DG protein
MTCDRSALVATIIIVALATSSCGQRSAPTAGSGAKVTAGGGPNVTAGITKRLPAVGRAIVLNDLRQLGLLYHQHIAASGEGPADLAAWQDLRRDLPDVYQAIGDGRLIVVWGVRLADQPAGAARSILAYEKDAPTRGGNVLMADGSVRTMSLSEFQAAPRARGN